MYNQRRNTLLTGPKTRVPNKINRKKKQLELKAGRIKQLRKYSTEIKYSVKAL